MTPAFSGCPSRPSAASRGVQTRSKIEERCDRHGDGDDGSRDRPEAVSRGHPRGPDKGADAPGEQRPHQPAQIEPRRGQHGVERITRLALQPSDERSDDRPSDLDTGSMAPRRLSRTHPWRRASAGDHDGRFVRPGCPDRQPSRGCSAVQLAPSCSWMSRAASSPCFLTVSTPLSARALASSVSELPKPPSRSCAIRVLGAFRRRSRGRRQRPYPLVRALLQHARDLQRHVSAPPVGPARAREDRRDR